MMKQLITALIMTVIFINCGVHTSAKLPTDSNKTTKRDTIIPLNKIVSLHYGSYNKDLKLWYNLSIINNKKSTKINKETDYQGVGSELFTSLSPNAKYVVVDSIIKDYVYTSEKDSTLHENYTCSIIDLKNAKIVETLQQDCDGRWDKNNQWISSGGKVVFK